MARPMLELEEKMMDLLATTFCPPPNHIDLDERRRIVREFIDTMMAEVREEFREYVRMHPIVVDTSWNP